MALAYLHGGRIFAPLKLSAAWCGCAIAGLSAGWLLAPQPTHLTFISVGQGDCAVLQTSGATVLIDDGPIAPNFDSGKRIVLPELEKLGASPVDLILLSHPDQDHVGGTGAILKAFPQAKIAMSSQFIDDPHMREHLSQWGLQVGDILWLGPSAVVGIGHAELRIDDPALPRGGPDNDGSMFVHLQIGKASAVFSGDADAATEVRMEPREDWSAQVMKVGHHGSYTATDASWLRAVHPSYAVISCGKDNVYGHPSPETVSRLQRAEVTVFRTDTQGDIEFDYDPEKGFVARR